MRQPVRRQSRHLADYRAALDGSGGDGESGADDAAPPAEVDTSHIEAEAEAQRRTALEDVGSSVAVRHRLGRAELELAELQQV